ncbi:MAG: hypothetical protein WD055_04285 [Candidatus Dependentiae bacterium]
MKNQLILIILGAFYPTLGQSSCQCLQKKIDIMGESLKTFSVICHLLNKTYKGEQVLFEAYISQLESIINELLITSADHQSLSQKLYIMNELLRQNEQSEFETFVKELGHELCIQPDNEN